jgi:hypothetical protein
MAPTPGRNQPLGLSRDHDRDRIEERPRSGASVRWSIVLTWFMRILAILWIMKGLGAWTVILGVWGASQGFEARPIGFQATIIYFALIDLVAAIGLWMVSSWGGVMWLLAVMSHLILAAFFPGIVTGGIATVAFFVILVVLYLAVSWLSAREAAVRAQS